jgi:NAD-dependent deacetylase
MDPLEGAAQALAKASRVVALTGAGVSAESGVPTFRGEQGLWRKFRPEELANPQAFARDPLLVWEWYAWRQSVVAGCAPNAGHRALVELQNEWPRFVLITQNVDGLHTLAGSREVIEMHGNIWRARCVKETERIVDFRAADTTLPPHCECGELLRPHIVWFGEALDRMTVIRAMGEAAASQVFLAIGTSSLVTPAANLPYTAGEGGAAVIEINLEKTPLTSYARYALHGPSGEVLPRLLERARRLRPAPPPDVPSGSPG